MLCYDRVSNQSGVLHMMGARIAALRRRAGLSQAELAHLLQCSASAVGMYEQGRREPSVDILVKLSRIFQVSTDYLLTGMAAQPQDEEALSRILRRSILLTEQRLELRPDRPFTRQELIVLFAAMLMEA